MEQLYNPHQIELAAQKYWEEKQTFRVTEDLSREKFYCLGMFPYPSGRLHMGHVRNYTLSDVIARYQRMLGKNVLHPMGWDAFGLPAENAAIKNQVPPAKWTYENINSMRSQLKRLGFAYDWKREFATCDPNYYRWEQWLFIQLLKKGLAYKKNAYVNWDPVDQTVLANEQVIDGKGWRSGAIIERREISQWFLKITAYADELLNDLNKLAHWPTEVRTMQSNWIGRSEGVSVHFSVAQSNDNLVVFTTRPDTLFGVTYLAIAAEHPLAQSAAKLNLNVQAFVDECRNIKVAEAEIATLEKRGINSGLTAIHPITGKTIPIWIANFVLMSYGTGAVMSVPAHDQRDFEFAKQYQLPLEQVISPADQSHIDLAKEAYTAKGILINSEQFTGLTSEEAFAKIADFLEKNKQGERTVNFRLRDWGVSRQRYWGTPIPIVNCPECGPVPVDEENLPVVLPEEVTLTGTSSPLKEIPEFYNTTCPQCGHNATRETDTFDTFVESSWYYTRFACVNQDKIMLDDRAQYWTPVDQYIGGIEHAVLHLLYARFFHKVLRDEGLLNSDEPFERLLTLGMVLKEGSKMSKSKGNIVDPDELIEKYGTDTVRLFIIFAAPPEQSLEWSDSGVEGCYRFLKRLWSYAVTQEDVIKSVNRECKESGHLDFDQAAASPSLKNSRRQLYEILTQARFDFERLQFNTVASACMKILNLLQEIPANDDKETAVLINEGFSILLRLLAPISPHITSHLWHEMKYPKSIIDAKWPKVITEALKTDTVELVVQVNGKLRGKITIATDATQHTIESIAVADENIKRHLAHQNIQKIIYVPGKLLNLVVSPA